MQNPNEYSDEDWAQWSVEAQSAVGAFWQAGASTEDIEELIADALSDVGSDVITVLTITEYVPEEHTAPPKQPKAKKNG